MDGRAPTVRRDRHMGCSRHHRVSSRHVLAGTRAVLAAETGSREAGGKHRQDRPDPCRRCGRGGLPGDQVPGTATGRTRGKREKDRLVDTKVQDAINQLGSDKASTRIAGVYALADIADRYKDSYRQRVVDILCGYLRSDRSRQPVWDASGHLVESVASDEAVEFTIIAIMRKHLRKKQKDDDGKIRVRQTVDDDQLWCACTFDLHEATFHEAVNLADSTFEYAPSFSETKFERGAYFDGAHFTRNAYFYGAHFTSGPYFSGAHFTRGAYFSWAHFTGYACFDGATFTRDARFDGAEFRASAAFSGIQGQPSFGFEECKFNEKFRDDYEWGPIPIPEDNDGLPAGAVWEDFQEEDGKDGGTTNR